MPGGIVKQIVGKLAYSKSKGKLFVAELGKMLSPDASSKEKPEQQKMKKK